MRTKQHGSTEARLGSIIDQLQESGHYWFTREDIADVHGGSEVAFRQAALRLQRQSRIVMPRRGFYVIVPLEYRSAGAPPPAWFLDALMAFQGRPYYVGLLSAAALHGAGHQLGTPHKQKEAAQDAAYSLLPVNFDKSGRQKDAAAFLAMCERFNVPTVLQ